MNKSIRIPIVNKRIEVLFPKKCVYCGLPSETTLQDKAIAVDRTTTYGTKYSTTITNTYSVEFAIPYCKSHSEKSMKNNDLLSGVSIIGILIGIVPVSAIANHNSQVMEFFKSETIVEGFGAILIGLMAVLVIVTITAGIFTWLAKYLLSPFNRTLLHQTGIGNLFGGGVLGINITFTTQRDALEFKFANTEIAGEFAILNGQMPKNIFTKVEVRRLSNLTSKRLENELTIEQAVDMLVDIYSQSPQGVYSGTPAAEKVRAIGEALYKVGGLDIMLSAHGLFRAKLPLYARSLEMKWNGIGEWLG